MKTRLVFCVIAICIACLPLKSVAADDTQGGNSASTESPKPDMNDHQHMHKHHHPDMPPNLPMNKVGVDEHLGKIIDLDAVFTDENRKKEPMRARIRKPSLILPVYYSCPQACSIMLANLSQIMKKVPLKPGEDFQVFAVSFDADDTPEVAGFTKSNYAHLLSDNFPKDQWMYLTGEQNQIDKLMDSLGFHYQKQGPGAFLHPNVLIAVSAEGKIIRYLYGPYFLPFDVGMALTEANKGEPQLSVRRLLTYCFDYDPDSKSYVFKSFQITAISIISILAIFLFFLLRKGNQPSSGDKGDKK